jgi:hypothetical protein
MATDRFGRYNKKCTFFSFRFRKDKDEKYIEFLKNCPNKQEFIRRSIDQELAK